MDLHDWTEFGCVGKICVHKFPHGQAAVACLRTKRLQDNERTGEIEGQGTGLPVPNGTGMLACKEACVRTCSLVGSLL